jgi:hypothetical protein
MNKRKVSVGFSGGQVLALRLSDEKVEAFRSAIQGGGEWHQLDSEDGPVLLNLAQVVFLRVDAEDQRIGF